MKDSETAGGRRAHLSPDALVLLRLQEVEQHLQEGGVLAVGLHHVSCAGYLLAKSPQRHLVESQRLALQLDTAQSRARVRGSGRLTCLLASDEESCSMSMMMGKSSSIHFLISRPLTWWGGHRRAASAVSGMNQQGQFLSNSEIQPHLSQLADGGEHADDHSGVWVWVFKLENESLEGEHGN